MRNKQQDSRKQRRRGGFPVLGAMRVTGRRIALASVLAGLTAAGAFADERAERMSAKVSGLAIPTPQQAAWHDLEVGMFIHFGP